MSRIVVAGGSFAGLFCAIQLMRRGHDVSVIERDPFQVAVPSSDAFLAPRSGAPHTVQGHSIRSRAVVEIRRALPDLYDALLRAGAVELRLIEEMPSTIADRSPRPGDDDLIVLLTRRFTLDRIMAEFAHSTSGLDFRYGVAVGELVLDRRGSGPPRVSAVHLSNGDVLDTDVLVDASGRRTLIPGLLAAKGIDLPLEHWDCGLVYFTQHYRVRPGAPRPPLNRVFAAGSTLPSIIAGWFPGDNDTAMLSFAVLAEDSLLKRIRYPDCFQAVAAAIPTVAPWLGISDPLTDVFGMGALRNTLRRVVRDGVPRVLGLHLVGDAACTTNPILARGLSFAAIYARLLLKVLDEAPDDLTVQARLFDDLVAREVEPSFRENALADRAQVQIMRADLAGQAPPEPPTPVEDRIQPDELLVASFRDPELYRAQMRYATLLDPPSALSDRRLIEHVRRVAPPGTRLSAATGPTRADLTRLISGKPLLVPARPG